MPVTVNKAGTGSGTIVSYPVGIDCGSDCSETYTTITWVTLSANPDQGSIFIGWSGDCFGTGSCEILVNAAKNVTATFELTSSEPDLVVTQVTSPASGTPGGTIDVSTDIANLGDTTHNLFGVNFFLSPDSIIDLNDIDTTWGCDYDGLASSATATCGGEIVIPDNLSPGNYYLGVYVDVYGEVTESNETNNGLAANNQISILDDNPITELVEHYYQEILGRIPDTGGQAYWEGEAHRVQALGANVQEVFRVMAGQFFTSTEYRGKNTSDTQYVTDLYETFFDRPPDTGGLNNWLGQLVAGLPRDILMYEFLFSDEFTGYMQGLFGDTSTRPEMNMVMDFYRGILGRLPDDDGYNNWLEQLRAAQCAGAAAVENTVDIYSDEFINSPEYQNRNRNDGQYIQDLYYAFLRRGGDLAGYEFWFNQVSSGAQTREQVRREFLQSPEFQVRVQEVIAAGCLR